MRLISILHHHKFFIQEIKNQGIWLISDLILVRNLSCTWSKIAYANKIDLAKYLLIPDSFIEGVFL